MLSVLITHIIIITITITIIIINKNGKRNFGGNGYVFDMECSDVFMDGYLSSNSLNCIH